MKKLIIRSMILALIVSFTLALNSFTPLNAAKKTEQVEPTELLLFEEEVEVNNKTEQFKIGFVTVMFRKHAMAEGLYPVEFEVKLYAEDGLVYIEFEPDFEFFLKDVKIHVSGYSGYLYDVSTGENIYVEIQNKVLQVDHFSRWCIAW